MRRSKLPLAVAAIAASGALAAVAGVVNASRDAPEAIYAAPATPREAVRSVDASAAEMLSVFRRQAGAQDHLPSADLEPGAVERGANPNLARYAGVLATGGRAYLVPAPGGICLASDPARLRGCSSYADVRAGRTSGAIICSPALPSDQVEVFGFLPDGASGAVLTLSDGTSIGLDLVGGVYSVRVPRRQPLPVSVEWQSPDGRHATSAQVPTDAVLDKCTTASGG